MSADNYLLVTRDNRVMHGFASSDKPPTSCLGTFDTFEEACRFAFKWADENYVEYGVSYERDVDLSPDIGAE